MSQIDVDAKGNIIGLPHGSSVGFVDNHMVIGAGISGLGADLSLITSSKAAVSQAAGALVTVPPAGGPVVATKLPSWTIPAVVVGAVTLIGLAVWKRSRRSQKR